MIEIVSPAIVLRSKFVMPSSKEYSDYVSYIDREDAKRKIEVAGGAKEENNFAVYHSFIDYVGDEEKKGELFTSSKDSITKTDAESLKEDFKVAEKNGSPMWQDVISFDNEWLEEQGLYDQKNNKLDEGKLKNVVRSTMNNLFQSENMEHSALWTASFHYNTDNIHVHIATVEPIPTRKKIKYYDNENGEWKEEYRAKRKQGSLDRMKSTVVNQIVDRTETYQRLDELIKGTVQQKRESDIKFFNDERLSKLLFQTMTLLPDDLRQWKYGYESINDARPYIDEIVDIYLDAHHEEDMQELNQLLDEQVTLSKRLYGEDSAHEKYKDTKLDELKKRMGNAVLTEMRDYQMGERRRSSAKSFPKNNVNDKVRREIQVNRYRARSELYFAIMHMKYAMRKTFHEYQKDRNISEYDRMMDGYE